MTDGVFRNATTGQSVKEPTIVASNPSVDGEAKVEPSYTEYEAEKGSTYLADRFGLGDKIDIFADELSVIEEYIDGLIKSGEIANSIKAVEKTLREMELLTNLTGEDRSVIKIETLSAHIDFLNKAKQARKDFGRYN